MSQYTKSTNFATKDNLTPGDPLKVVRGTEIDTEFNNIATAVATKTDNSAAAITGGTIDGATVGATTPATGSFTTLAASGTTTLAGALVGAVTQAAFNTVSTTLNLGGAATAVNLGAATGTATVNNTTLAAKAITASTTLAVTGTSTLTGAVTATAGVSGPITSSSVSITGGSITGITDLAVADGGTGASTAAGGLNNLLPSQTGNASKYLQTDGTNATWDAVSLSTADITGTLGAANGGTGVSNNAAMTVTGSGNFAYTRTLTGTTNVTFPTTGTLATLAGTETLTNKTLTSPTLTTPTLGVATGTSFQGIIGNVTPAAGNFTTLGASSTATLNTLASSGATLTGGTINGMTVGATTASTGAFTTVTASTAIGTASGGTGLGGATPFTSGGVVYASSTSALATGSALTFDGTNLSLSTGGLYLPYDQALYFKNLSGTNRQILAYANNTYLDGADGSIIFRTGTSPSEGFRLTSSSLYTASGINVGIGTSSPAQRLDVNGNAQIGNATAGTNRYLYINGVANKAGAIDFRESGTTRWLVGNGAASENGNFEIYDATNGNNFVLTRSGNLGLGVTPNAGTSGKVFQITDAGHFMASGSTVYIDANAYFDSGWKYITSAAASNYYQSSGAHIWQNAASGTAGNPISFTQAMTLDASGALLLGTTSANPANANGVIAFGGSDAGIIYLERQTGTDQLRFYTGGNRLGYVNTASSTLTIGTANYPLAFSTNDTERARIDSSGFFKTRANGGAYFGGSSNQILNNNNTSGEVCLLIGNAVGSATNNTSSYSLIVSDTGGDRLYVYGNGNVVNINNSYGTLSDVKLKENIVDATPKLDDVMRLQVRNFNLKSNPELKQIGFVAQELEQIFPALIDESPDRDAEGNITEEMTKSIKTSVLVPILVKAIQEQQAIIESLKARLDAANL